MEQRNVKIGEVDVPIILDGGEEWFPVSYISTKVLLRSSKGSLVNKNNKEKISDCLQNYIITYGDKNIQESRCVSKTGLIKLLKNTQIGRLSVEQRTMQNKLHTYIGIDLLPIEEQDTTCYKEEWYNELDSYTTDVVKNTIDNENVEWFRMCSKCNKHYPLTSRFFAVDNRTDKGFIKLCRICDKNMDNFTHMDKDKNRIIRYSTELYEAMNKNYLPKIFTSYMNKEINRLPDCYKNKESYLKFIKHLYDQKVITEENLTSDFLISECRLTGFFSYLNMFEVYSYLFGDDFYFYLWKYPLFKSKEFRFTDEICIKILNNYMIDHDIKIDNVFTYDYVSLLKNFRFRTNDILGLIVKLYNYQYAGYLFKIQAVNYYKDENNLLFDLRYLVEEDMKINIDKIPLYLTKYTLQKKSTSLYNYIITNKNGSLYEWFDKLYPNTFTLHDFEMNGYRNEFDSDKEMYIHELLTENFKNVIYNQRNTDRTINFNGMIPDWLVMTEYGVWIVEYFGLYEAKQYGKSSRVTDYIEKTKRKIERYKEMKSYKFIFLYPDDIEDDFKGCRDIIEKMKENPYISML